MSRATLNDVLTAVKTKHKGKEKYFLLRLVNELECELEIMKMQTDSTNKTTSIRRELGLSDE